MNLPEKGLTLEEFKVAFFAQIKERYRLSENPEIRGFLCKKCGAQVQKVMGYVSLHALEFQSQCSGGGQVTHATLPYCPNCEGPPTETSTCIHVPLEQAMRGLKLAGGIVIQ